VAGSVATTRLSVFGSEELLPAEPHPHGLLGVLGKAVNSGHIGEQLVGVVLGEGNTFVVQ